ncbi:DivIVA domain-containing protein [Streptomyces sp. NPDC007971]|uniref:DivIVA domain-containing protein n=1 Tax=Streptomyces sp. NPDC007971 TaxID=3364799 RepID=UPI0036E518C6
MSGAPVSPHGFGFAFTAGRGRGYRPDQVDAYATALFDDRDAAWERAARLTVLARQMEEELLRLREVVARLAPQTYETLGERARQIFQLGQEEATAVREGARREAQCLADEARAYAESLRSEAQAYADALCAEADEFARQRLLAARAEEDHIRVSTRREVKEGRSEALADLRETRRRCSVMLTGQQEEFVGRLAEAEREAEEGFAALDVHCTERIARAEAELAEAEQTLADARHSEDRCLGEARARADEMLAEARAREERIARETERVLREHGETWDEVQAQMDHVRSSLMTLTGRVPVEVDWEGGGTEPVEPDWEDTRRAPVE